jgi:hypothetical protein
MKALQMMGCLNWLLTLARDVWICKETSEPLGVTDIFICTIYISCEVTSYKVFQSDEQRRIQCNDEFVTKRIPITCLLDSFDAAMKYIRSMGLNFEKIHVCKNNCILFRKEKYVKLDVCPVCCEADSRWKDADTNKRVP